MPKSISAAVGHRGVNVPADVITVQFLLNCVPPELGGPVEELVIDGVAGAFTHAAILRFQRAMDLTIDGRIDTNGGTIAALLNFDPIPDSPPIHLLFGQELVGGKGKSPGKTPVAPQGSKVPLGGKGSGKTLGGKGSGKTLGGGGKSGGQDLEWRSGPSKLPGKKASFPDFPTSGGSPGGQDLEWRGGGGGGGKSGGKGFR